MVNHYYFYGVDRDFGPFFLKFCAYFPYTGKSCLNGHEYVKRQLTQRGIAYEALDNGILSCAEPRLLQALCDGLSAARIEALVRQWLARLPPAPGSAYQKPARCQGSDGGEHDHAIRLGTEEEYATTRRSLACSRT